MFDIIFYKNKSEPNRVDKTSFLDRTLTIRGTLKTSTSIINPVIIVDFSYIEDFVVDSNNISVISNGVRVKGGYSYIENLFNSNYCYISEFGRYYYIDDIISLRTGLWEISMSVDVLMSNKEKIATQVAIVARNEFEFNDMIIDQRISGTSQYEYTFYQGGNLNSVNEDGSFNSVSFSDIGYVISLISTKATSTSTSTNPLLGNPKMSPFYSGYYIDPTSFFVITRELAVPDFWTSLTSMFQNNSDFIVEIKATPMQLDSLNGITATEKTEIFFGNKGLGTDAGKTGKLIYGYKRLLLYSYIDTPPIEDFTDLTPYSKYFLYIPFYGTVEIDSGKIENGLCNILCYDIDVVSGDFVAYLSQYNPALNEEIVPKSDIYNGNMYISIPVGSTNATELYRNAVALAANTAGSLISGATKYKMTNKMASRMLTPERDKMGVAGERMQNKARIALVSDLLETTGAMTSSIISDFTPVGNSSPTPDTIFEFHKAKRPFLIKVKGNYFYPQSYNHYNGKPLMKSKAISEVHGYTEISQIHLENLECTANEISEIERSLLDGVILP